MEQAKAELEGIDNVMLFEKESEMIDTFLTLIEDADILSGWNSEGYDIPYTVNRTSRVLSKDDTRRFCLWGQLPKKREYEKYGKSAVTFDLIGRVHLDSLNLYRKYTYEERHTYRLDAIGEIEVGENKVPYEGTLDQLYNNDFRKFIEYNIQDTALLDKLDKKLRFIDLSNELAHANTVLLQTTMGAVAVTEQAIVNEAHRRGMQVPNRPHRDEENTQAAGAYVAFPKKGLHKWIASKDLNSLYPSVIRALNMDPATVIGQLKQNHTEEFIGEQMNFKKKSFAGAWEGKFGSLEYDYVMEQRKDIEITIDWENGEKDVLSAAEVYRIIHESNQPWMLSANGTIFTYEQEGIIPGLLKRWYSERKDMQKKLKAAIDAGNKIEEEYWDKRQLVKKINLNSLYGAILNPHCRFYDGRIGQSTTLTGRCITRHMACKTNEILDGEYDYKGRSIIYGDTDSVYFSAWPIIKDAVASGEVEWNTDKAIEFYDVVADEVNDSFAEFMHYSFGVTRENGAIIKAGREIVASRGIFITKKRYAALIVDVEGIRTDINGKPGKIKVMGLEIKRSDTPADVQDFLGKLITDVLAGMSETETIAAIRTFKKQYANKRPWEKGVPKRVNNLTNHTKKFKKTGKCGVGHAMAAINWNRLREMNGDKYSTEIPDGGKTIVCRLKPNSLGMVSVAYPIEQTRLPEWFTDLPFDETLMEQIVVSKKVENLLGELNWNLKDADTTNLAFDLFTFS